MKFHAGARRWCVAVRLKIHSESLGGEELCSPLTPSPD